MAKAAAAEPTIEAIKEYKLPKKLKKLHDETLAMMREDDDFEWVTSVTEVPHCRVWLASGEDIPCLLVAQDKRGNFTIMDRKGQVRQYLADEID